MLTDIHILSMIFKMNERIGDVLSPTKRNGMPILLSLMLNLKIKILFSF